MWLVFPDLELIKAYNEGGLMLHISFFFRSKWSVHGSCLFQKIKPALINLKANELHKVLVMVNYALWNAKFDTIPFNRDFALVSSIKSKSQLTLCW